ncbi:hypothetical protein [Listeria seeligeri]|uniref:hypothetical protein n=1 Tax=Listeria seeligeri TaxID=1640 RepID=UPI0022EB2A95|nr:hypothetical protein [Listeria seeligeri]
MEFKDLNELQDYLDQNLLTKAKAMEITGQSAPAFAQAVSTGVLKPFFQQGEGKGPSNVRLYLKQDIEEYAQRLRIKKEQSAKRNA